MITSIAIICACTLMGALARHGLGGAWRRWEAVTLFAGCMIPAIGIYAYDNRWQSWVIGAAIVAIAYCDLLCKQFFATAWEAAARYGAPILILAGVTGVWWVLAVVPLQFAATAWASGRFDREGFDPHEYWEYILGACMGFAYSAGPLFRAY